MAKLVTDRPSTLHRIRQLIRYEDMGTVRANDQLCSRAVELGLDQLDAKPLSECLDPYMVYGFHSELIQ